MRSHARSIRDGLDASPTAIHATDEATIKVPFFVPYSPSSLLVETFGRSSTSIPSAWQREATSSTQLRCVHDLLLLVFQIRPNNWRRWLCQYPRKKIRFWRGWKWRTWIFLQINKYFFRRVIKKVLKVQFSVPSWLFHWYRAMCDILIEKLEMHNKVIKAFWYKPGMNIMLTDVFIWWV